MKRHLFITYTAVVFLSGFLLGVIMQSRISLKLPAPKSSGQAVIIYQQ